MTRRQLARRSLVYYFRAHLGALAGAIAAAAVLIGALAVGDSVRESLKAKALERLAGASYALATGDRFFTEDLRHSLMLGDSKNTEFFWPKSIPGRLPDRTRVASLLVLPGSIARQDGQARVNRANIIGINPYEFFGTDKNLSPGRTFSFSDDQVWLNPALAQQLGVKIGDALVIRIAKPSALSRDAIVTPRDDQSVAFRGVVGGILEGPELGNVSLRADQADPLNVFVSLPEFARLAGIEGRANLLLADPPQIFAANSWRNQALGWAMDRHYFSLARLLTSPTKYAPTDQATAFLDDHLRSAFQLSDAELNFPEVPLRAPPADVPRHFELSTRRIFLDPAVTQVALSTNSPTAPPTPLLTYLVNSISHGDQLAPYSMVTAVGAPYTPADLKDDEIVLNEWLAEDLGVKPGDSVNLAYYRVDAGTRLIEHTNSFRVRSIVPLKGLYADKTLMPEFPGLAKAESTRDWDAGFDLVHPIRDKDEAYWKQWRGTPKAYISLAAGQKIWANRFGDLTAIRWFVPTNTPAAELWKAKHDQLLGGLDPRDVGLVWQPIRESALKAATSGQDFGQLFIAFSFFLIVSALLLTSMLFQFGLEQRATETGILLAIGWTPRQVRGLLFREGLILAAVGSVLGAVLGAWYAKGVIWGLSTLWKDAVAGAGIQFHLTGGTLALGILLSIVVAAGTLWFSLRRQADRPARQLLNQGAHDLSAAPGQVARWIRWGAWISTGIGLLLTGLAALRRDTNPELFFGAGALWLIAALLWVRLWLARSGQPHGRSAMVRSLPALAMRGLTRRPSRSLGTIALLASAAFLIVAVAANRLDATRNAAVRSSGTGGFALWGESTLPVLQDLNTLKGQEFYGLDSDDLKGVSFVGFRVRDGDDASCLNLNQAQRPRLLGVNPSALADRGAFTFTKVLTGLNPQDGWRILSAPLPPSASGVPEIPAIGDANSIQWALGKKIGDTLDYLDERGQPFKIRLVGAVANSILQGNLIVAESDLVRLFPSESGHRVLLIDASGDSQPLSAALSRALQDVGLELTPTVRRLDRFNSVQNTYLNTFQVLGGLGLLLGSIGLGVVVVRNVFERRGELALMQAVGFEAGQLRRLLLTEHVALLLLGVGLGTGAAALAVLPALGTPSSGIPWSSLALTLSAVVLNGLVWTIIAVTRALRGRLLEGLREL